MFRSNGWSTAGGQARPLHVDFSDVPLEWLVDRRLTTAGEPGRYTWIFLMFRSNGWSTAGGQARPLHVPLPVTTAGKPARYA